MIVVGEILHYTVLNLLWIIQMNLDYGFEKERSVGVYSLRISQFDLPLSPDQEIKHRYSPEEKIMRNRNSARTPLVSSRDIQRFSFSRQVHSSQERRLSSFLQGQINKLHQSRIRMTHFSDLAKDKINELKTIMQLKSLSLKKSNIKEPIYCHFSEYRLNEPSQPQNMKLLHARNTKNSPFTRAAKAKNLNSKSVDAKRGTGDEDFKSIELGSESKYGKIKKMVLFGGSIRGQLTHTPNPEMRQMIARHPRPSTRGYHTHSSRRANKKLVLHELEQSINDCRPWQMQKGDSNIQLPQSP